ERAPRRGEPAAGESGDGGSADPALAPAHTGPGEQLDAAQVPGAEAERLPDLARGDLLAAAYDGAVGDLVGPVGGRCAGTVQGVGGPAQPGARRDGRRCGGVRGAVQPGGDGAAGQMPFGEGEGGAAGAGGLAGRPDAGSVGALLVVHGDGGAVEAAAQGGGEIGVRQHAVADGERVAGQEPLGAGPDAALCVECGDRDSG